MHKTQHNPNDGASYPRIEGVGCYEDAPSLAKYDKKETSMYDVMSFATSNRHIFDDIDGTEFDIEKSMLYKRSRL